MAVALAGSGEKVFLSATDVDYGDRTQFSAVVTITLNEAPATSRQLITHFGATAFAWAWQLFVVDTNELAVSVYASFGFGPLAFYSRKTTDLDLVNGGLYRLGIRARGSTAGGPEISLWVNGIEKTLVEHNGESATWAVLNNAGGSVTMGTDTNAINPPLAGDYAEFAVWRVFQPDAIMEDLTTGRRPDCYPADAALGIRALTVASLTDWVDTALVTEVGAANATHPSMLECVSAVVTVIATLMANAAYTVGSPDEDTVTITA